MTVQHQSCGKTLATLAILQQQQKAREEEESAVAVTEEPTSDKNKSSTHDKKKRRHHDMNLSWDADLDSFDIDVEDAAAGLVVRAKEGCCGDTTTEQYPCSFQISPQHFSTKARRNEPANNAEDVTEYQNLLDDTVSLSGFDCENVSLLGLDECWDDGENTRLTVGSDDKNRGSATNKRKYQDDRSDCISMPMVEMGSSKRSKQNKDVGSRSNHWSGRDYNNYYWRRSNNKFDHPAASESREPADTISRLKEESLRDPFLCDGTVTSRLETFEF